MNDPEPAFAYSYLQYAPTTDRITTIILPSPKPIIEFCYMLAKLNDNCREYGVIYFPSPKSFIKIK